MYKRQLGNWNADVSASNLCFMESHRAPSRVFKLTRGAHSPTFHVPADPVNVFDVSLRLPSPSFSHISFSLAPEHAFIIASASGVSHAALLAGCFLETVVGDEHKPLHISW